MIKEIDIFWQVLILMWKFTGNSSNLELLDEFMMKLFENDVWCKNSDLILIREKLEKINNNLEEANNLLFLNGSPTGLIILDESPEKIDSKKRKISELSSIIQQLEEVVAEDTEAKKAIHQIKEELCRHNIH